MPEQTEISITRLLSILAWVAHRGEVSVNELAEHFDRPVAAIRTYIQQIGDTYHDKESPWTQVEIDWNLYCEEDRLKIIQDFDLSAVLDFSEDELIALVVALRILESVLPEDLADDAASTALELLRGVDLLAVDLSGFSVVESPHDADMRRRVESARRNRHALEISYVSRSGQQSKRIIFPQALELVDGHWLVHAFCMTSFDNRSFRIDRITQINERIDEYTEFESLNTREAREVKVIVEPRAQWLVDNYVTHKRDDGTIVAWFNVYDDAWAVDQLISLGKHLIECDAPDLVFAASQRAQHALKNYAVD
ncbi:MAG: WYL domain-containing protein [Actinomycetaceae bacterium]|nr:WYL domain-containing protein [Actinomycetaceae bacterium]